MLVNTAKYLKTITTDTINLGVNSEPVTFYKTVIRTINIMAVINIFLCVAAGVVIHFLSEVKGVLFPALLEAMLFAGVLLLNAKKFYSIGSAIMFITHCASFAYFGIKFGPLSHVGILWMYLVCAAYLIFKRNGLRISGMALATVCLILIEVNYHTGLFPSWNLSLSDIEVVRWCIYGCVGILGASLMYFFMRRNAQQARLNEMLIAQTTEQYQRAANRNLTFAQQQELFIRETAHEINNPAHAIMALASKYLCDLREDKPSIL
jgi:signal transduction histidine kinase